MRRIGIVALVVVVASPALSQEPGWHYSPLPGEGDRAAMGCSHAATPDSHSCLVVRCESDFSVGVHVYTSRAGSDVGRWLLEFDKGDPRFAVTGVADDSPYGARIEGDVTPIIEALKNGAMVYLDPEDGEPMDRGISLSGSLYVINQALYFCAPKVEPEAPVTPD